MTKHLKNKCVACGKNNCKHPGGWNYRIIGFQFSSGHFYDIREVYYKNGVPDGYTSVEVSPHGETLKELWECKKMYEEAFMLPVLLVGDDEQFTGKEHPAGVITEPTL